MRAAVAVAVTMTATCAALLPATSPVDAARYAPAATTITSVGPVNAARQLAPGYEIRRRYGDASCERGSPTVGAAYSCFTPRSSAGVYDACWVQADKTHVLCMTKPWVPVVARLHVTGGYDDSSRFTTVKRPWGLRLRDGKRCLVILGPVHVTQGRTVRYRCSHRVVLAGSIDRRPKTWTINGYRKVHGRYAYRRLGAQPIAVAWKGKPSSTD